MLEELALFCSRHCTGKEEPRSCTGPPSVRLLRKVAHSRKSSPKKKLKKKVPLTPSRLVVYYIVPYITPIQILENLLMTIPFHL